jgi:hypothetical protein
VSTDTLFTICSAVVVPQWLLMVVAPRWKGTRRLIAWNAIPLLLAAVYLYLVVTTFGRAEGGFGSLDAVERLFANREALLAGWIHYLVLDLFVGGWMTRDAIRLGISSIVVAPCLLLTFLLGPAGLLLYWAVRSPHTRRRAPFAVLAGGWPRA